MSKANKVPQLLISGTYLLFASFGSLAPALAQEAAGGGPIDIVADEQEFAEDHVLAKGKVRVTQGDTIIDGPIAKLFRDESGAASKAVFTGSPRLVQGKSKINAARLTFEIKTSRILAEGNAHSEVYTDDDSAVSDKPAGGPGSDKIITDSQMQEYERESGRFEAHGNVRVVTGDIKVNSKHMKIVYGTNRKPEAAIFTGDAVAVQNKNVTQADSITYFLTTQRLQATGHVRSRVIEEKEKSDAGESGDTRKAAAENGEKFVSFGGSSGSTEQPILIYSDAQDYNKQTNRMDAVGNVRIYYEDSVGKGPRVAMLKDSEGRPERLIFTGRSQVTQPGRKWIGDKITLMVADRKVLAEGNTKAVIVQNKPKEEGPGKATPAKSRPAGGRTQLAEDGKNPL
ncbi:MAG: hypothetical protein KC777_09465 [Cyanobacteria bacterium HKST-UBA02]|nr:hypothetical protein [Cyanobacteria bacterium HKST-UBA02]